MDYDIAVVTTDPQPVAIVRGDVPHDGIGAFVGSAFGEVLQVIGMNGVAGMPFARYDFSPEGFRVEAGFPVASAVEPSGRVHPDELPGGQAVTTMHVGPYREVAEAYAAIETWMAAHGWAPAGAPWESYLDGPEVAAPRTVVYWPCRAM